VPRALAGERLDRAIPALAPSISRTRARKLIEGGAVFVDRVRIRVCSRGVHPGQTVTCYQLAAPAAGEPRVVHDAADLVVIDKPVGMAVEPTRAGATGTLAAWLRKALPGALTTHRLDAPTSGLCLCARGDAARAEVNRMLAAHEIRRSYLAVVSPAPAWDELRLDAALDGRPAVTLARVTVRQDGAALLALELETGRTRQIRRHLAGAGVPIVGDRATPAREAPRLMLHAARLRLLWRAQEIDIQCPPPTGFQILT